MPDAKTMVLRAMTFRYRAEELRTIADGMTDEETREIMERIAEDYERMAENRERAVKEPR